MKGKIKDHQMGGLKQLTKITYILEKKWDGIISFEVFK